MIRAVCFHHLLTGSEKRALNARSSPTGLEEEDEKLNDSFQRPKTQKFKQSSQISQNEASKIPISLSESKFVFQDKPKKIDLDDPLEALTKVFLSYVDNLEKKLQNKIQRLEGRIFQIENIVNGYAKLKRKL